MAIRARTAGLQGRIRSGRALPALPGSGAETTIGSYVEVSHQFVAGPQFELRAWVFPTRFTESPQGIVARLDGDGRGFGLFLVENGRLELRAGSFRLRTREALERHCWYEVHATVDADKVVRLEARPRASWTAPAAIAASGVCREAVDDYEPLTSLLIGAGWQSDSEGVVAHFDGKIAAPTITGEGDEVLASWDFRGDWCSDLARDTSGNNRHGRLVNLPTRAVTGPSWSGSEFDFACAPEQYDAIHFHHDDVEDAGWEPSFRVSLPPGTQERDLRDPTHRAGLERSRSFLCTSGGRHEGGPFVSVADLHLPRLWERADGLRRAGRLCGADGPSGRASTHSTTSFASIPNSADRSMTTSRRKRRLLRVAAQTDSQMRPGTGTG